MKAKNYEEALDYLISKNDCYARIRWVDTDACMDIVCRCGKTSHIDGTGLYEVRCPHCKRTYTLGIRIEMVETEDSPEAMEAHCEEA